MRRWFALPQLGLQHIVYRGQVNANRSLDGLQPSTTPSCCLILPYRSYPYLPMRPPFPHFRTTYSAYTCDILDYLLILLQL